MLISNHANPPIGLDISDHSLKLVQLKKVHDKIKFQALGKYRLHNQEIKDGEIKDEDAFAKAAVNLIKEPLYGTVNSAEVIACVPNSKTYIKLITVAKSPNRLANIISAEIEKHIPLSTKEMYFDWQVISEDNENYYVLIGVAPKKIVESYINALRAAKLSVIALEIESISLCRSILAEEGKKFDGPFDRNYCLIDIGALRTSMTIYSRKTIVLSVSLPLASDEVTEKIARTLEIKLSQAEKAKIVCGLDKTQAQGIIHKLLLKMIDQLNNKIIETIDYFGNHYAELGPINEIILCGGGSNIKSLDTIIAEYTKTKTSFADPLKHISGIPKIDLKHMQLFASSQTTPEGQKNTNQLNSKHFIPFASAIGLGLRNIFITQV